MLAASKPLSALLRKTFSVGSREKALNREKQVNMIKKIKKRKLCHNDVSRTKLRKVSIEELRLSVNPVSKLKMIMKKSINMCDVSSF